MRDLEGCPLSLGGTGDPRKTERQQISVCEAAILRRETLRRSCMILCYARYIASTVPRYGIGVSGKLSPWHGGMRCMKHVHHLLQRLPSRMRGKGKHTCGRS